MNFTKLSGTTRLFLMTVIGTCCLGDGFTIRNLRFVKLNLQLFVIFHTPFQCTQMEFSLTMNKNLFQFLGLFNNPSRIFLTHTIQNSHHLFCIGFIYRTDCTGIFRIRIFNEVETVFTILAIQCVTCFHIFQLHGTANITGTQFINLLTVSSCTNEQLSHTFLRTSVSIIQVITFPNDTAHHLEVLYITNVGFNSCLEEIK